MGDSRSNPHEPLAKARRKAKVIEAEIQSASDQAGVIGAVLSQELPATVQQGDVAQAIRQTGELEHQLAESAASLADVSAELGREILKGRKVARQLGKTQTQVEKLTGEAAKARTTGNTRKR